MWTLLNPRLIGALIVAGILATSHYTVYKSGKQSVQRDWDAATLTQANATVKLVQEAREKEKVLTNIATRVTKEYENAKKINHAMSDVIADRVRDFNSELDKRDAADAATPTVNHGATAERQILRSCAGALRELAEVADGHKEQIIALQGYVVGACVSK